MEIYLETVLSRLSGGGIRHALLEVGSGRVAVATERWGRILGPFDRDGRSILWLNPDVWADPDAFSLAVSEGAWNVGGERCWIAPEIRLNIRDRADFWGTYALPPAIDPGSWSLSADGVHIRLSCEARLDLFNPASGDASYQVERTVSAAPNPLRSLRSFDSLMAGIDFAGYVHRIRLTSLGGSDPSARLEAWTLCQLVPPGRIVVPCAEGAEHEDYYEPADGDCMDIGADRVVFSVTGKRRYKVGLRSPQLFGRAGYLKELPGGEAELLVRAFSNDPGSEYVEEPDSLPLCRGLSFHVYNDGGAFGGFGELECNGRTIGGPGAVESVDDFSSWLFRGPSAAVRRIGRALLGRSLES